MRFLSSLFKKQPRGLSCPKCCEPLPAPTCLYAPDHVYCHHCNTTFETETIIDDAWRGTVHTRLTGKSYPGKPSQ